MKSKLFIGLLAFFIFNSCTKNVVPKFDFSQVKTNEEIIIDLSKVIEFDKTSDKMKLNDKDYFSDILDYLISSMRKSKILVQSKHGERFLFETHSFYGNQVRNLFLKRGILDEKIESKIGFNFGKQYSSIFSDSRIILVII